MEQFVKNLGHRVERTDRIWEMRGSDMGWLIWNHCDMKTTTD